MAGTDGKVHGNLTKPLECFKCHRFGHYKDKCPGDLDEQPPADFRAVDQDSDSELEGVEEFKE